MGKRTSNRITVAQKRETALTLAIAEASYSQIAEQIGVSKSRAHQLVQEALKDIEDGTAKTAETFRKKMIARNNRMIRGLISRAQSGDTKSADTVLRIQDQNAKLAGAYAPSKTALTDPTGEKEYEGRQDPRKMTSEERLARIAEITEQLNDSGGR